MELPIVDAIRVLTEVYRYVTQNAAQNQPQRASAKNRNSVRDYAASIFRNITPWHHGCRRLARRSFPFLATPPSDHSRSPARPRRLRRRGRAGKGYVMMPGCSRNRNNPPGKPAAFAKRQSWHRCRRVPCGASRTEGTELRFLALARCG